MSKTKKTELLIYQSKTGKIEFRGDLEKDTIWGNLNQIAELFGRDKSVISRHIKNIFKSNELKKNSVVAKIATVQKVRQTMIKTKKTRMFMYRFKMENLLKKAMCKKCTFVWFLRKAKGLPSTLTASALTSLTLLVAGSHPKDKDKMIGLTLLLLKGKQND